MVLAKFRTAFMVIGAASLHRRLGRWLILSLPFICGAHLYAVQSADTLLFKVPVERTQASVSQGYGIWNVRNNGYHTGIDLYTLGGQPPVRSTARGTIVAMQRNGPCRTANAPGGGCADHGLGNSVIVEHTIEGGGKLYSFYGHLSSFRTDLRPGLEVMQNEILGVMGASGYGLPDYWKNSDGTVAVHLHFEIKNAAVLHDPAGGSLPSCPTCYGYTPMHPDGYGYHDPNQYLEKVRVSAAPACVGCSASSSDIRDKFVAAYNAEGTLVLGQAASNVNTFVADFYSSQIVGYYQDFAGTWTRAVIDYLPGAPAAYSVKYGFSELFYSQDSQVDLPVYKLVVAPTANEARSAVRSAAGTDYTWQPFLKGSMYFYNNSSIGGGINNRKVYTWGYLSERYEREGGRLGEIGLPLVAPIRLEEQAGWIWWYQWFEKGFIWQATSSAGNQIWTYVYRKTTDVFSNGTWTGLGWVQHR